MTPYIICSYAELNLVRNNLNAHYILGDHIDASESCGGDCGAPSSSGFEPIGTVSNRFGGQL